MLFVSIYLFFECGSLKNIYTKKQRNGRIFSAVFFCYKNRIDARKTN